MRTVAVLAYIGGRFDLEQSDIIQTLLPTGRLDRQGEDNDRNIVSSGQFFGPVGSTTSRFLPGVSCKKTSDSTPSSGVVSFGSRLPQARVTAPLIAVV